MCWGCVIASTKAHSAVECHFDILQQLKSTMVHSKTSLREASSLPGQRGANNWRDGKVKVAGI